MIGSTTSIQVAAFKLDTIVAAGGAQYQGGNKVYRHSTCQWIWVMTQSEW